MSMMLERTPEKPRMKDFKQAQIVRMDILAQLYKRGYSYREMRSEVMARLDLKTYSLGTVKRDIERLLKEWRETRIENFDLAVQLELNRIDELIKEAWEAWEKSKTDYEQRSVRNKGVAPIDNETGQRGSIEMTQSEQSVREITQSGDPRYLDLIHRLLMERRKILGLYSPEKKEISGDLSFTNLLMETGIIDEEE